MSDTAGTKGHDGSAQPITCPNCGDPVSGRFCSSCGTPVAHVACGACRTELAPGARFCHVCGTPVAAPGARERAAAPLPPTDPAPPAAPRGSNLPLAIVALAFLAVVAIVAAQSFARAGNSTEGAPEAVGAQTTATAGDANAAAPTGPAPDISKMSPEERASRLYDRMMAAFEAGHMDTVRLFAPMATGAYEMLDSLTLDQRYDLGRIGEISGAAPLARAQADTILQKDPNHLLGLILAAQAAHSRNDLAAEQKYLQRLSQVAAKEQARNLPGYREHQNDIKAALDQARKK